MAGKDWEDYLESIYFDPSHPGSFGGPDKLYRAVKKEGKFPSLGKHRIRRWVQSQESFSLLRPLRRKFKRNRVVVYGIDDQWDADLMDMVAFAKKNDGMQFVLVAIDIFTRHLWLEPLPSRKAKDVVLGFERIFAKGRKPVKIRTDKGSEFVNKMLKKYLDGEEVHHFVSHNEMKANYAERVIRTVKSRIVRYFAHKQTHRYLDILQDLADSYNATYHRTLGMAPNDVIPQIEGDLWIDLYRKPKEGAQIMPKIKAEVKAEVKTEVKKKKKNPYKFKIGSLVRMSHLRTPFTREYDETWTGEVFRVASRFLREGIPVYRLRDFDDREDIRGTFYQPELQRVHIDPDQLWKVEKIIKTRRRKGAGKEYLVKWLHWPKKYNSWVKASDVEDL